MVNVSISSQLSNDGSVTESGALLTDTFVMVVLTLHDTFKVVHMYMYIQIPQSTTKIGSLKNFQLHGNVLYNTY